MERFTVRFLQVVLLLGIAVLLGALVPLWQLSLTMAQGLEYLSYMRLPVYLLAAGMMLSAAAALGFGFVVTTRYGKGQVFTKKTMTMLEKASLAFFAGLLFAELLVLYTRFNIAGSITNLFVHMAALVFLIFSVVTLVLSNVIRRGIILQEEQDLTI